MYLITYATGGIRYENAGILAQMVKQRLELLGKKVMLMDEPGAEAAQPELVFAIGGDGTVMRALKQYKAPIFGIGADVEDSVGFLTGADHTDWTAALERVLSGEFLIEERMALQFTWRGQSYGPIMNEVSLRHSIYPVNYAVHRNGEVYVGKAHTRGLLVASATGSTAESLGAGGLLLEPESTDMIVTPLNYQRVNMFPYPFPQKGEGDYIELEFLPGKYEGMTVEVRCDGQHYQSDGEDFQPGEKLLIERYPEPMLLATFGLAQHKAALKKKGIIIPD